MARTDKKVYSDYKYLEKMVEDHTSFPMTKVQANALLPRFMNAVTIMAESHEKSRRLRLACAVEQVLVFREGEIPKELRPLFEGFEALISEQTVPDYAKHYPDSHYFKRGPAAYLSPKKAHLAMKILIKMFEEIVWWASFDEP